MIGHYREGWVGKTLPVFIEPAPRGGTGNSFGEIMADISHEDFKIILRFALHVAKVDEEFAGLEKQILRRFVELARISEEERMEMMNADKSLAHGLEHLSSGDARELLVKSLCAVAHSDGVMHDTEREFIDRVNTQLGNLISLPPFEEWEAYEHEVLALLNEMD